MLFFLDENENETNLKELITLLVLRSISHENVKGKCVDLIKVSMTTRSKHVNHASPRDELLSG